MHGQTNYGLNVLIIFLFFSYTKSVRTPNLSGLALTRPNPVYRRRVVVRAVETDSQFRIYRDALLQYNPLAGVQVRVRNGFRDKNKFFFFKTPHLAPN